MAVWAQPSNATSRSNIQALLKQANRYSGPVDGIWGANTIRGIQITCNASDEYSDITVDGVPGPSTARAVALYGSYATQPLNYNEVLASIHWSKFHKRLSEVVRIYFPR
ncbi:peptidoglycan-binding protein [Pseudoclavibacter helvolus]|uniref:Peptidoglycan hydrolase-like protein with peptidoglycan-binding domain n=1 Tax=Pseudoclavibacter helvolus TaxID=255205 RepID=A0A7W4US39_9MICO|nr:peptidoglycan-binding protein [Pseudoclavibacter helvolus]MBB2959631.1 peptidoglycan hydrolase-like protein with peptidoglycan-binding domain [Pseudoclavibacter helvolus]